MAQDGVGRRHFAAGLAAALAWPLSAPAIELVRERSASRLGPPEPPAYSPPQTMSAVRDLYSRMTVPVRINGRGPFAFVVDTGSNQTVISSDLAADLGLISGEAAAVNGVAGVQMAATTRTSLGVGSRTTDDATLLILRRDDIGGQGLLALDDLDGQAVTLDFRRQTVRVEAGRRLARDDTALTLKAYRRDGQLLLVDAHLDAHAVVAFLDTGSESTIGNLALRARSTGGGVNQPRLDAPILSATGQIIDGVTRDLPRLRLGEVTLSTWPVTFADLHTFRIWDLVDRPAMLLGVDVLSRFEYVCLDFLRNEVRFRVPRTA